jgi:hypothetical protein
LEGALASSIQEEVAGEGKEARVGLQHARNTGPSTAVFGSVTGKIKWGKGLELGLGVHLGGRSAGGEMERSLDGFLWRLSMARPQRRRGLAAGGGVHGQRDGDKGVSWGCAIRSELEGCGLRREGTRGGGL